MTMGSNPFPVRDISIFSNEIGPFPPPGAGADDAEPAVLKFHMAPVGGIAMVPLAALLIEAGHRVTGSDGALYPPMSTLLEGLQVPVFQGFSAEHVPPDCDCMIVGN